jgi:hypothetical protein
MIFSFLILSMLAYLKISFLKQDLRKEKEKYTHLLDIYKKERDRKKYPGGTPGGKHEFGHEYD